MEDQFKYVVGAMYKTKVEPKPRNLLCVHPAEGRQNTNLSHKDYKKGFQFVDTSTGEITKYNHVANFDHISQLLEKV
jgi:hypothetical protein